MLLIHPCCSRRSIRSSRKQKRVASRKQVRCLAVPLRVVRVLKPLRRWTLHQRSACTSSEFSDCLSPPGYPMLVHALTAAQQIAHGLGQPAVRGGKWLGEGGIPIRIGPCICSSTTIASLCTDDTLRVMCLQYQCMTVWICCTQLAAVAAGEPSGHRPGAVDVPAISVHDHLALLQSADCCAAGEPPGHRPGASDVPAISVHDHLALLKSADCCAAGEPSGHRPGAAPECSAAAAHSRHAD